MQEELCGEEPVSARTSSTFSSLSEWRKETHRLRDGAQEHAEGQGVAVEGRLARRAVVRADELEEALQEPRLEER